MRLFFFSQSGSFSAPQIVDYTKSDMVAEPAQLGAGTLSMQQTAGDDGVAPDSQKGRDPRSSTPLIEATVGNQGEGLGSKEKEIPGNSNNSADSEILYPGVATKVAVGFSLALAVLLVHYLYFNSFDILI